MGKIIIIHVYEEEGEEKQRRQFELACKKQQYNELTNTIHDLLGTNEQEYDPRLGYN